MDHFSLTLPPSDTLWHTPTREQQLPHHQKSFPPFFYHPSSLKHDEVESDNSTSNTTTTTNTTNSPNNATDRSNTTSSSPSSPDHDYMFEKPLTPSDVGKLNRLVIPKQYAEKYFPLAAAVDSAATASGGGGGVLLAFEDESGKCWEFRYSYWNSSQSYVLTKGWSRYVKDKKLDAGNVVLFHRHRFEPHRFFIGWRKRGSLSAHHQQPNPVHNYGGVQSHGYNGAPQQHQISSFPSCRPHFLHAGTEARQGGQKGRKSGGENSKRLRLFGVNLECQIQEDQEEVEEQEEMSQTISDGSSLSSQGQGERVASGFGVGPTSYNYFDNMVYPPNHHYNSHMVRCFL